MKHGIGFSSRFLARIAGAVLAASLTSFIAAANAGEAAKPTAKLTPGSFELATAGKKEVVSGRCISAESKPGQPDRITCNFIYVRFDTPDNKTLDKEYETAEKAISESRKHPDQLAKDMKDFPAKPDDLVQIQKRLRDPNTGPKTKQQLGAMLRVFSAKMSPDNFKALVDLEREHDAHSCTLVVWQDPSTEFERIGPTKWLANAVDEGVCKVARTYALAGENEWSWTLTQKNIAVGRTDLPFCKEVESAERASSETVYTWKNIVEGDFEIPCDFISHWVVAPE